MKNAACSYCGRKGILIYPVRYAVACPNGKGELPNLAGNFKIVGAPTDISPAKYVLRALRTGYLYTYEEKRKRLKAYMVLPNGALWEFAVEYMPNVDPDRMSFCCLDRKSLAHSYCIDVEPLPGEMIGNIWIGWSNVLWTKSNISRIYEDNWRKKHMQCIDGQAMLHGFAAHAGKFKDSSGQVAHLFKNEEVLKNAFGYSNAPVQREIEIKIKDKDMENVLHEKCPYGGFIVAVNDPVGICSDLSELTLPTDHAGFDETCYWGEVSSNLLKSLETAVNADAQEKEEKKRNFEQSAKHNGVLSAYARWSKSTAVKYFEPNKKTSNNTKSLDAWGELIRPRGKPLIDLDARNRFSEEYDIAFQNFRPIAVKFDKLHTAWLRSEQLSNWMQGIHDSSDIHSGVCYRESLAQCIGKSAGNEHCMELLKRWLAEGNPSDERALYARAMLFNQKEIINAAEPYLKKEDVPIEGIFNIYKRSVDLVSKNGTLNSFDRLLLSTMNVLIYSFSRASSIIAKNITLIGLSLTGEVIIRPASTNANDIQKWILLECRKAGIQFNESNLRTWVSANGVAKAAIEEYKNNAASIAIELDLEKLRQQGVLSSDAVNVVKIPGFEQAKRWISSDAPVEFKLGVVTIILQIVALSFAMQNLVGNNEDNRFETRWKASFGLVTLLSSIAETAMSTLAARSTHPLSIYLSTHWGITELKALTYAKMSRVFGFLAGVAIACSDIWKGTVLIGDKNFGKGTFYLVFGLTAMGLSYLAFKGTIACWWLLAVSIIFSFVSPKLDEAALQEWIGKSFFGTGSGKFPTLGHELNAYRAALGG